MRKTYLKNFYISLFLLIAFIGTGCSKSQSYSELLREEEKACNWYLSGHNVYEELPENSQDLITCETLDDEGNLWGDNAPFYKMDEDGYVYMQIVRADFYDMVSEGDLVYFRFVRENIKDLYQGIYNAPGGNGDNLPNGTTSFVYKNTYLSSSTTWGTGIQMPLQYVGYNSEVNLVLKSYYGFADEQAYCNPYIMNIRYFKPEY